MCGADVGQVDYMVADDDLRVGLVLAHPLAHLLELAYVRNDRADADDIIAIRLEFPDEPVERGEVQ